MSQHVTTVTETIDLRGGHLVERVKELVHEGNVRRIIIKDPEGEAVMEMPVTAGVVGLLAAPKLAAIGALAAIAADYSLEVERDAPGLTADARTGTQRPDRVASVAANGGEGVMERYRSLLDRYVELYNAGDLDGVMDLYAEDSSQLMPDGIFRGRSAIRDRLAKELDAFSDLAHRVVSYVEGGDAFADEWVFVGTHTGPVTLPDGTEVPPTGRRIEVPGMEFVAMRDGKIIVDNLYYDNLAVAAQLGLLPENVSANA